MNIVVFTKNWLGDVIFETPAIQAIKENFPNSHLIAVTHSRCRDILKSNPYVDEIIHFDNHKEQKSYFSKFRFIQNLRKRGIDLAFLFHRAQEHAWIAYLAGARKRVGYTTKWRSYLLTHPMPEPLEFVHDVQYFMDLVSFAGLNVKNDYCYEFYFSKEEEQQAEKLLKEHGLTSNSIVAINPGANWFPKRWPSHYFKQLAERLVKQCGVQIVVTGDESDRSVAEEIVAGNNSNLVSMCGKTSLGVLGALFSKCRLVISNDTGPLHIAAGSGVNVVALFGPTQPLETGPLGRGRNVMIQCVPDGIDSLPWMGKKSPPPWMELMSVDQVYQIIKKEKLIAS